jgi:hypothetical protein
MRRGDVGDDHGDDDQWCHCGDVGEQEQRHQQRGRHRQPQHGRQHGAHADGHGRHDRQAGQVRQQKAARGTEEDARENRSAAEARQRHPVGQALAGQQQEQGCGAVSSPVRDERAELGLTGEQHVGSRMPGDLPERDGQPGNQQGRQRRHDQAPSLHRWPDPQRDPPHERAGHGTAEADQDGPAELRRVRPVECWQARQRERERAESAPVPEPGEDQRANSGREQPGQQHEFEHGRAKRARLHQQESADQRVAEEGADRSEAASGRDHHGDL